MASIRNLDTDLRQNHFMRLRNPNSEMRVALLAAIGLGALVSFLSECIQAHQGVRNVADRQGSRPMAWERSHKLALYAVKRCAGASNEGTAKVMCM